MISTEWVRHLEEDKKADFEGYIRNNTRLLDRLYAILQDWEDNVKSAERSTKQYDVANWSELQAHRNGNIEIISRLKDLLSL